MAPRHFTNPAPRTESARQAVKSFYCELCDKGYARMNEFEAHESSYDHQHKKRLKEMKQMQRDPNAIDKARRAERRAEEKSGLISIKPVKIGIGSNKPGGGFKKGGFKNAFGEPQVKREDEEEHNISEPGKAVSKDPASIDAVTNNSVESDTDDEYEYYNPELPTDCDGKCRGGENL